MRDLAKAFTLIMSVQCLIEADKMDGTIRTLLSVIGGIFIAVFLTLIDKK